MKSRFNAAYLAWDEKKTWDGEPTHVRAQLDIKFGPLERTAKPPEVYQSAPAPATRRPASGCPFDAAEVQPQCTDPMMGR